jgi:hypothetical protein
VGGSGQVTIALSGILAAASEAHVNADLHDSPCPAGDHEEVFQGCAPAYPWSMTHSHQRHSPPLPRQHSMKQTL